MHAAIDNTNVGHGAMAKEAIQLYLHDKLIEGGDACVQQHWRRIWRGYVAWATLGSGEAEIIERMMLVDKKQITLRSGCSSPPISAPVCDRPCRRRAIRSRPICAGCSTRRPGLYSTIGVLDAQPGNGLLEALCADINQALRAGIYEPERFAGVRLSAASRDLLRRNPRHGVALIDLGRSLLEDAYPHGITCRPLYPDIKAYYADRMADLIRRKAQLALRSHRRIGWLMQAFQGPPEA